MLGLSNRAARVPTAGGAAAAAAVGPPRPPPRTCAPAAAGWGAGTPACASQWQMLESRRPCSHVCQAHPRRVAKVTSQIQREISEMFIYDDVMQRAICPDRGSGNAVSAIAGITHVYVSNDLQFVKVYVSVYSDERGRSTAMSNLKRLEPYVRSQIGARVALRLTPEIRFEYDDSIEEEELVASVLGADEIERLSRPEAGEAGAAGAAAAAGAARPQAADDDDDDGGFFEGLEGEGEEEEEYEEDFGEEEEYRGRTYDQPGPFDDLFGEAPAMGARGGGGGGGGGGGRQQQQPPQQARATLGDAPLDRGAAAAGRAPANGFPSGAFRGKLTVITPLGQSVGSEPGPVDASLEFSQGDDGGLVADGEIAADVLGTRCTFDMKVACQPAAESFCGSGKDAWYCPVTSIERWDDPCIGNIRATPKAKSVSFCYGNGEVEVKEVKQMLAIVQGALPQEQ